jgi:hypothetical protein
MDSTAKQESTPFNSKFISFPSRYRYQGATNDHISQFFLIYLFHKVSQFFFSVFDQMDTGLNGSSTEVITNCLSYILFLIPLSGQSL